MTLKKRVEQVCLKIISIRQEYLKPYRYVQIILVQLLEAIIN